MKTAKKRVFTLAAVAALLLCVIASLCAAGCTPGGDKDPGGTDPGKTEPQYKLIDGLSVELSDAIYAEYLEGEPEENDPEHVDIWYCDTFNGNIMLGVYNGNNWYFAVETVRYIDGLYFGTYGSSGGQVFVYLAEAAESGRRLMSLSYAYNLGEITRAELEDMSAYFDAEYNEIEGLTADETRDFYNEYIYFLDGGEGKYWDMSYWGIVNNMQAGCLGDWNEYKILLVDDGSIHFGETDTAYNYTVGGVYLGVYPSSDYSLFIYIPGGDHAAGRVHDFSQAFERGMLTVDDLKGIVDKFDLTKPRIAGLDDETAADIFGAYIGEMCGGDESVRENIAIDYIGEGGGSIVIRVISPASGMGSGEAYDLVIDGVYFGEYSGSDMTRLYLFTPNSSDGSFVNLEDAYAEGVVTREELITLAERFEGRFYEKKGLSEYEQRNIYNVYLPFMPGKSRDEVDRDMYVKYAGAYGGHKVIYATDRYEEDGGEPLVINGLNFGTHSSRACGFHVYITDSALPLGWKIEPLSSAYALGYLTSDDISALHASALEAGYIY